jgi:hypothetical protein
VDHEREILCFGLGIRTKAIMKVLACGLDPLLDNVLTRTCKWIKDQYDRRKAGEHVGVG